MERTPLFEITSEAAAGDSRRLTTAANVRTMIGSDPGDDAILTSIIDRVSSAFARECGLAVDVSGAQPSFGAETWRATWFIENYMLRDRYLARPRPLQLPWRTPITAITSLVENGVTLSAGTDFQLIGGCMVDRLFNDAKIGWSSAKIVATGVAGFDLPTGVPPDLEAAAIEQVKYVYASRKRDQSLKGETVFDVYEASYGAPGGSGIGNSGLLMTVEEALAPYKDWATG